MRQEKIVCIFKVYPTPEIEKQYGQDLSLDSYISRLYQQTYKFTMSTFDRIGPDRYCFGSNIVDGDKIVSNYDVYMVNKYYNILKDAEELPKKVKHLLVPTIFPEDPVAQSIFMLHYNVWKDMLHHNNKQKKETEIALRLVKKIMNGETLFENEQKFLYPEMR